MVVEQLKPDLVTMDIEMPDMNGIEAVRAIRATRNRVPIIMFSTLTERGASATLDALSAGADDYVTKPANVGSVAQSMESVRQQLIPKIKALTSQMDAERMALGPPGLGRQPIPGSAIQNPLPGIAGVPIGTPMDFRVSVIPGYYGENAVIRILDPRSAPDSVAALKMAAPVTERLQQLVRSSAGTILVTAPANP